MHCCVFQGLLIYMLLSQENSTRPPASPASSPECEAVAPENSAPLAKKGEAMCNKSPKTSREETDGKKRVAKCDNVSEPEAEKEKHPDFPDMLEISEIDILYVRGSYIVLERKEGHETMSHKFKFDDFVYIQLLRCFRDLCFFTTAPSEIQFKAMRRFSQKAFEKSLDKKDFETNSHTLNAVLDYAANEKALKPHEQFLVRQFLLFHLPLLYAHMELSRLIGE